MALIAQTRSPLMAQRRTCQINTMRLIFDIPNTQSVLKTFMSKLLETFSHPMLQFLPQKLAEWIANNYAEELNVPLRPDLPQPWSTATLNRILQTCRLVSDRKGINIHTFQAVEFESDLYSCYAHLLSQIQYGTPSDLGKKCQGVYIYMVYVMYITRICQ